MTALFLAGLRETIMRAMPVKLKKAIAIGRRPLHRVHPPGLLRDRRARSARDGPPVNLGHLDRHRDLRSPSSPRAHDRAALAQLQGQPPRRHRLSRGPCRTKRSFTLFISQKPWPYYARPRLGEPHDFRPADVEAVRDRQRELRVPQHFAWVHEVAPTLRGAMPLPVIEVPLLVLEAPTGPPDRPVRFLDADDPGLRAALAVEQVASPPPGPAWAASRRASATRRRWRARC